MRDALVHACMLHSIERARCVALRCSGSVLRVKSPARVRARAWRTKRPEHATIRRHAFAPSVAAPIWRG